MRIACIGQMVADIITKGVSRIPENGAADIIESVSLRTGGCAMTSAILLDRLGCEAALFGAVGKDPQGRFLLDCLKLTGIHLDGIRIKTGISTTTSVIVINESGERSFLYAPGSVESLCLEDIPQEDLDACDLWHLPGVSKLTSLDIRGLLERGRSLGKVLTLDTDYDATGRWRENVQPYLSYLNYCLPSYDEARRIAGAEEPERIADYFLEQGVRHVVIKMGRDGCYAKDCEGDFYLPGHKVECLDTTGAGDSFVAGFLCGVDQGWDLRGCCRLANACGALSVMAIGAGGKITSLAGVLEFMGKAVAADEEFQG